MSDDDKSTDFGLICNQRFLTYNKLWGMNPMGLSDPWNEYLEIIELNPVKNERDEPNGL